MHENALLKRRIYGNKTERGNTEELQLTLGNLLDGDKQLQKQLDESVDKTRKVVDEDAEPAPKGPRPPPEGPARSFREYSASRAARDPRSGLGAKQQTHRVR
jgi:hypothetical protein